MHFLISTFVLILAAVISIIISQNFSKISVNYISMFVGILLALFSVTNHQISTFNPELFMGIIVAPLLFFEGQSTRLNLVGKKLSQILHVTIIMIIISTIFAGLSLYYLTPISLPLAFILASISTPTDATALQSVTNGLRLPKKEGILLKMESLFNDASGIILLNMAVLWYSSGSINYQSTIFNFLVSALGGALFGFTTAWIFVLFRQRLLRSNYNSLNAQNLIYIMTPFVIYYLSERLHISGIIAVVCAGLIHNAESQRGRLINAEQVSTALRLESLINEVFNSSVFVILGLMLARITIDDFISYKSWIWIFIGLGLYIANLLVRFLFALIKFRMSKKSALIFSLGGIHGAVTLALAFMLLESPIKNADLNLVLMSESTLIVLSLIVPTIVFPFLLTKEFSEQELLHKIDEIRFVMVQQAIKEVARMQLPKNVKDSVIYDLNEQSKRTHFLDFIKAWREVLTHPTFNQYEQELETRAFLRAFYIERRFLIMILKQENKFKRPLLDLYNEVLIAESLVINPNNQLNDGA